MANHIINRNFFRLLRAGAFGQDETVEPMSAFKWNRLMQIAEAQDVVPFIAEGMRRLHIELPTAPQAAAAAPGEQPPTAIPPVEDTLQQLRDVPPQLTNFYLKRTLRKIMREEEHNPDASEGTTQLLQLIIHNVNLTLRRGISLRGIIDLGRFLRQMGDSADHVVLEQWLRRLGLVRMAALQASVLIDVFHFDIDEIPYVHHEEKAAEQLTLRSLTHTAADTAENWHFRMRTNGMVQNNSRVLRRNLRRSIRYMRYNPLETSSNFMANFVRTLSEIEE